MGGLIESCGLFIPSCNVRWVSIASVVDFLTSIFVSFVGSSVTLVDGLLTSLGSSETFVDGSVTFVDDLLMLL